MGWQNIVYNQIIVQGSGAGIFIYNGNPALGNLIGAWTAVAGTDAFGNIYPQGLYVATSALINNATIVTALINNAIITQSQFNQGSVFESTVTFDSTGGMLLMYTQTVTTVTLTALTTSWTAPGGSYTAGDIRVWASGASGDGGSNSAYSGAGGGAGGFAETPNYPLTPATVYTTVVPQGGFGVATGNLGNNGGAATFDYTQLTGPTIRASGGNAPGTYPAGGQGGFPVVGTIGYNGGNGGAASTHNTSKSGGGGGSGGPTGQGGNGGQNGPAGAGNGGANGGAGVNQNTSGNHGGVPGAGGSGAGYTSSGSLTSGPGGDARITITYNTAANILIGSAAPVAGVDALGNAYGAGFTGQISAFTPNSNPTTVENFHSLSLDSGWTGGNGFYYRMTSEGTVEVFGSSVHAAFTGTTNINNSNPLPAGYRPTRTWNMGGTGIPGRAGVEVTSGGVLIAVPGSASCTEADAAGKYPLGI